jgi:hypothetical protein
MPAMQERGGQDGEEIVTLSPSFRTLYKVRVVRGVVPMSLEIKKG